MILAFADFAASLSALSTIDRVGSHPPLQLRLELLFTLQSALDPNWSARSGTYQTALVNKLTAWRDILDSRSLSTTDLFADIVIDSVSLTLPQIAKVCRDSIAGRGLDLELTMARLETTCGRIGQKVPPNEIPHNNSAVVTTLSFADVVNAGWAFALSEYPDWRGFGWQPEACRTKLNDLLLKALELIEIRRLVDSG